MKTYKYILELTVFLVGAVIMIFELVGSRILGPYLGTSIFVWTSLIGVILGSLSLGYFWGGKIADKKPDLNNLSLIIFLSAVFMGLTIFIKNPLLIFIAKNITDIKISPILASLILFFPTNVLLGMVSPYAVKLKINNLEKTGSTAGNLYAISTIGSIVGTFLSGFYLIPIFGINKLLTILVVILTIISIIISKKKIIFIKLIVLGVLLFAWVGNKFDFLAQKKELIDVNTAYNRVWISDQKYGDKVIRKMEINNNLQSIMFLDSEKLFFGYTEYYHLVKHFNPNFKKVLMLGGGGYSYPKDYLNKYPEAKIDVVEIDPIVTELAKKYFNLKNNPKLNIYNEDGRIFLNRTKEKYDAIFGDAFDSSFSIPYQLTTKEAVQKEFEILNDEGLVILNIFSPMESEKGLFLRAEYATYKSVFPQVYLFPVDFVNDEKINQNIILIALKSKNNQVFNDSDPLLNEFLQHLWKKEIIEMPILTDDDAPVDYYISKII